MRTVFSGVFQGRVGGAVVAKEVLAKEVVVVARAAMEAFPMRPVGPTSVRKFVRPIVELRKVIVNGEGEAAAEL